MGPGGSPVAGASFCPYACSPVCSVACSYAIWPTRGEPADCDSSEPSRRSLSDVRLQITSQPHAAPSGSSMRNDRSPVHDASPEKIMTLTAPEFIRRFLLHVLPRGFHRIRYYGWLGARVRRERLAHCRQLLAMPRLIHTSPETRRQADYRDRYAALTGFSLRACPVCGDGYMEVVELVVASRAAMMDTS